MIIVHETFICKPGNASKMAKMFKEMMNHDKPMTNVLTDMTGQYNKVVMVAQYENLAAYEKAFESYKNPTPEMKEQMAKMPDHKEMYLTGSREIFQVW